MASIPEAIDRAGKALSQRNGGAPLTKQEIVDETLRNGDPKWSRGSIMPDDFCYNRKNKGSRPDELCGWLLYCTGLKVQPDEDILAKLFAAGT